MPPKDTTKRSTWWSVTAFNDEIALIEGTLPEWVREVYGGREQCPKSGTIHYQGAIRLQQQERMSKVKSWLPTAHLEPARDVDCLTKYAMKSDTAIGPKEVRKNPILFFKAHEICELIASQTDRQTSFSERICMILRVRPELAGQLMNPSLRRFYLETEKVWLERAGGIVLPPGPDERNEEGLAWDCEDCGKSECEACDEKTNPYIYNGETIQHAPATPPCESEEEGSPR